LDGVAMENATHNPANAAMYSFCILSLLLNCTMFNSYISTAARV